MLQGTILPGVTRKSVIQLARQLGYEVEEAPVSITEAMAADEIFTTGTAVVVSAVGSLTYKVRLLIPCLWQSLLYKVASLTITEAVGFGP